MKVSNSQLRLAEILNGMAAPKPGKGRKRKEKPADTLPISQEMIQLMQATANAVDDDGYLQTNVGSLLSQPLTAASVFFPTAALMGNLKTATKTPQIFSDTLPRTFNTHDMMFSTVSSVAESEATRSVQYGYGTAAPPSGSGDEPASGLEDLKSRLKVLWLKRRAQQERDDGLLAAASVTMGQAVREHLGSDDYSKARLLEPTMTSDPLEILATVKENFFLYDAFAHTQAGRIQRCYQRRLRKRGKLISKISALFRGHRVRKRFRRMMSIRKQCAVLIQRRFRFHLKRMHALATKIKIWYKLRKDVKAYQKRLFIYQMARHIQRIVRGFMGRRWAARLLRREQAARRIQRTVRAYVIRCERAYVIARFHKVFFFAARKLQMFTRRVQAVQRARVKLLLELLAEDMRRKKEVICINEMLRTEKIRNKIYMKSQPGILQVYFERRRLLAKRLLMFESLQQQMADAADKPAAVSAKDLLQSQGSSQYGQGHVMNGTEISFVTPDVIEVLDKYDEFDDNRILMLRLPNLLADLNVRISTIELTALQSRLDPNDAGHFEIPAFLRWFESEEADELVELADAKVEPLSWWRKLFFKPKSNPKHLAASDIRSYLSSSSKYSHDRLLNREIIVKFKRKEYIALFRRQHRPKYQCCQCLESFALFTDYYQHFDYTTVASRPTTANISEGERPLSPGSVPETEGADESRPGTAMSLLTPSRTASRPGTANEQFGRIGLCVVTQQRAMFCADYWNKSQWQRQRMVEDEIMRVNDEHNHMQYEVRKATIEALSNFHYNDRSVSEFLLPDIKLCVKRYYLPMLLQSIFPVPAVDGTKAKDSPISPKKGDSSKGKDKGKKPASSKKKPVGNAGKAAKKTPKLTAEEKFAALKDVLVEQIMDALLAGSHSLIPDIVLDLLATSWKLILPLPWLIEQSVEADKVRELLEEELQVKGGTKGKPAESGKPKDVKGSAKKKGGPSGKGSPKKDAAKSKSTAKSTPVKAKPIVKDRRKMDKKTSKKGKGGILGKMGSTSKKSTSDVSSGDEGEKADGQLFSEEDLASWSAQGHQQLAVHPVPELNTHGWLYNIKKKLSIPALLWSSKCKSLAFRLSSFSMKVLEIYRIEAETASMAILRFRSLRPRRLTMSDDECLEMDLQGLTSMHFLHTFSMHADKLRLIATKHRQLLACKSHADMIKEPEPEPEREIVANNEIDANPDAPLVIDPQAAEEIVVSPSENVAAPPPRSLLARYLCPCWKSAYRPINPAVDHHALLLIEQHTQRYQNILREHAYAAARLRIVQQTLLGQRVLQRIQQKMDLILCNKRYVNILNMQIHMRDVDESIVELLHGIFVKLAVLQDQAHMDLYDIDIILQSCQSHPMLRKAIKTLVKSTITNSLSLAKSNGPKDEEIYTVCNHPIDLFTRSVYDILSKQFDANDQGYISFSSLQANISQLLSGTVPSKGCFSFNHAAASLSAESKEVYLVRCRRINRLKCFLLDHICPIAEDDMMSFWKSVKGHADAQEKVTAMVHVNASDVSAKYHQKYHLRALSQPSQHDSREYAEELQAMQLHNVLVQLEADREAREIVSVLQDEAEQTVLKQLRAEGYRLGSKHTRSSKEQLLVTILLSFLSTYLQCAQVDGDGHESKVLFSNEERDAQVTRILSVVTTALVSFFDSSCLGALDQWEVDNILASLCTSSEVGEEGMPLPALLLSQHLLAAHKSTANAAIEDSQLYPCKEVAAFLSTSRRLPFTLRSGGGQGSGTQGQGQVIGMPVVRVAQAARCGLIGLQRRRVRQAVDQALALTRGGDLLLVNNTPEGVQAASTPKEVSLLLRAQLLAMRQLQLFLDTSLGALQLHYLACKEVHPLYLHCLGGAEAEAEEGGAEAVLRYAYALHSEGEQMLSSEVPHLLGYLLGRQGFGLRPSASASALLSHTLHGALRRVRWMDWAEAADLLHACLHYLAPPRPHPVGGAALMEACLRDSRLRMASRARQQSLLIALPAKCGNTSEEVEVEVAQTNYRCSVLGLYAVSEEVHDEVVDKEVHEEGEEEVYQEVLGLHLLAAGLRYEDLLHPAAPPHDEEEDEEVPHPEHFAADEEVHGGDSYTSLSSATRPPAPPSGTDWYLLDALYSADRAHGQLDYDLLPLSRIRDVVFEAVEKRLPRSRRMTRACMHSLWGGIGSSSKQRKEVLRLSAAMRHHPAEVEQRGADFLKELVTGISHCAYY